MIKINAAIIISLILSVNSIAQQDSTFYQKGVVRAQNGQFDEAIKFFDEAIKQNPEGPFAWYNRGLAKSFIDLNENALADFSKAIEIDPNYLRAYLNRGIAKRKLLDFDGAQRDYMLAISKAAKYSEAYYHRGYIFELLGNKDSACHFYKIASSLGLDKMESKLDICNSHGRDFDKHIIRLSKFATSKEYGFTESAPIKVGGSPTNQREYLSLLRDSWGNPIKYRRTGSCCGYKLDSAPLGMAILDRYLITYKDETNTEKTAYLYLSFYEYDEPQVVYGFKTIESK